MPYYLFQGSYSGEAWGNQIGNPQNRPEAVRSVFEGLGGRIESFYTPLGNTMLLPSRSSPTT